MEKDHPQSHRPSQPQKKTLYQTYTDYIDPSSITVNYYLNRNFYPGQQEYIDKIKQWIDAQTPQNKPLVFKTSPGVGIKTILSRWYQQTIEENKQKKQKILPIIHFASNGSNSSNYFYCLYRIVIKLRQALKIKQNVDLLQQKIRKYFAYWLDICSTQIQKQQVIYCTQDIYSKIVIVIQGVDKFTDLDTGNGNGKQANIAFWLPQFFPKNVKVLCTVTQGSQSLQYFQKKQCKIIDIYTHHSLTQHLLQDVLNKTTILSKQKQQQLKTVLKTIVQNINNQSDIYKYIQTFADFILIENNRTKNKQIIELLKNTIQKKIQIQNIIKITNVDSLYDFIIGMYTDAGVFKKKLSEILMYFALSQKGITIKEIIQLTKFTQQQWTLFYTIFSPILIKHQSIYSIKCYSFIESIIRKDKNIKQNKQNHLIKYHEKIAQALQNTPNSIRKLQEQTYHLFVSKSYFKLKQIVSSIQNFLLMFNPNNKYQLSRYWQKLQQKGFDPVIEYNKAIQGFSMHYHPSDQNIFRIIVQISRFLKQFCDFQTYQTPTFRHPLIEGNMTELQKIGLLDQFTQLQIYVDNSFSQVDQPQNIPDASLDQQIRQVRQQYFPKDGTTPNQDIQINLFGTTQIAKTILEDPLNLQKHTKKIKKKINTQILSQIQQLNVDVPMNRQKFRGYYLTTLEEYMKNQDYNNNKVQQGYFEVEDDGIQTTVRKNNKTEFSVNKIKQNYKMRHIKPSLYYYKRWIWIQFPWVCISLNNNYSKAPQFCKQLECQDIDSYEQQAKYTKQALVVAIQAKQKKKMMFTKKGDDFNAYGSTGFGSRMIKGNNYSTEKFSASRNVQKSTMRSRVLQKTFSNVDLNLNSLTKQLELRKKNLPNQYKTQAENTQGIFLSEVNQNSQEDMRFINQRKQFQAPDVDGLPSNQILPKLKWSIKDHTNYQIAYIKAHIEQKKKKLNKIIFQNKKLADTYKQLKLKQNLTKKNMYDQDGDKHSRKTKLLQQYTQKKQDVINEFCKSILQKQRLKIILKLCAQNKTRNQQYLASLNYFLQNLKKMISWEKNNIKQITTQMNGMKVMKEKKQVMQAQKQRNAKIVEKQAKNYLEEKQKLQQQIQNISMIIAEDLKDQKDKLQNSLEGHLKNREQKNKLMMQQKKTKQLEQKLKNLQQQYEALKQLFELQGTDFEKSPKFQQLLEQNQKNKKLKIIYFQRKNKLQQIEKLYEKTKQNYEKTKTQKRNQQNERQQLNSKLFKDQINTKQAQTHNKNTNNLKIMLNNIALKLGVKSTSDIVPFLQRKLSQLKTTNPVKYHQIMSKTSQNSQKLLIKC